MNQQTAQIIELGVVAAVFAFFVIRLARRQLISFRYAAGWLVLCGIAFGAGLLIPLLGPIAGVLRISEVALIAGAAVMVLLIVCIQLTISISGMQREMQTLAEKLAILELEFRETQQVK
jgi:hypothetical protein